MEAFFAYLPWLYTQRRLHCFLCMKLFEPRNPNAVHKMIRDEWYDDIGYCIDRPDLEWPKFNYLDFCNE